jgi:hypothetical protein
MAVMSRMGHHGSRSFVPESVGSSIAISDINQRRDIKSMNDDESATCLGSDPSVHWQPSVGAV